MSQHIIEDIPKVEMSIYAVWKQKEVKHPDVFNKAIMFKLTERMFVVGRTWFDEYHSAQ